MEKPRQRALTVRAIVAAIAAVACLYIGAIGTYVALVLAPSAARLQTRTEALSTEYDSLRLRMGVLRDAFREARRLSLAESLSEGDRRQIQSLRQQLLTVAEHSAGMQASQHLFRVSPMMRGSLADTAGAESRWAGVLLESLDYIDRRDLQAALLRLSDAERAREAMIDNLDEAQHLGLAEMVASERMLGEQADRIGRAVALWGVLGAALLGLFVLGIRRRLYLPLQALDDGLARVAGGDLQASLPVKWQDEIGRLTAHFNQMTELLRIRAEEDHSRQVNLVERFGRILDHSFNEIYVFDAGTLQLVRMNQGAQTRLGYTEDDYPGMSVLDLLPDWDETAFRELVRPLHTGERPVILFSATHLRKNGSCYPVEITLQYWKMEDPAVFVAIAQDVTERRRAEIIQLAAQHISEVALTAATMQDMFAAIHKVVAGLMPADNFYIALYDAEKDTISFPYFVDEKDETPQSKKPGRGLTEYVLRKGEPLLVTPEVFQDLVRRGEVEQIGALSVDWLGVPLVADGRPIGVFVVQTYAEGLRYSEADLHMLRFISTQVAMAIAHGRAEQAVLESRQRLQSILDAAPFGAHLYELQPDGSLVFTGSNRSADLILGVDNSRFIGKTIEAAFPALSATGIPEAYRRTAADGVPYDAEQVDHDSQGIRGTFEVRALQTAPNRVAVFFRDITERRRAEDALQRERDLVARIAETSPVGITVLDHDGRITFANEQATRILGPAKDQITLRSYNAWEWRITRYDGSPLPDEELPFQRVMAARQPLFDMEHAIERPDGRRVLLSINGAPLLDAAGQIEGVVTTIQDVTSHVELQEQLRRSEEQYRTLVDGAKDIIFALSREGALTTLNPAFEEITGFRRDDWRGRPFVELLHPDDGPRALTLIQGVLREGPRPAVQLRVRTARGDYRVGELHTNELRKGEDVAGILGIVRDITERVNLEEQFRQAQKMESIGRLAGGVAHDFNNLLTVILGFASMAKDGLPEHDPARADLSEVEIACHKASALTRQLLAFARRQVTEPRALDLNAVTLSMDKMMRRLIGEDVELVTVFGKDLWTVWADLGQIQQVLVNLAVNARDAMPDGGKLTIETLNVTLDAAYTARHAGVAPGEYVMLAVSDTGHGITPEIQEHIFEPFFTTKSTGHGTGLGLATCYGIVQQAGGAIDVYSEQGGGATFKIYLPRAQAAAEPVKLKGADSTPIGSETILLVEDDEKVRSIAVRSLRDYGYRVTEASNGEEALQLPGDCLGEIDLLVTDVVMPQMGGRELAERMHAVRPNLKVLYTSGYTENGIVHHGVLDRGVAFLSKPYDAAALARKVREVLDEANGCPPV
jgi:PAS domain S-box-containing protein